ncbi:cyclopropane-fatty-acyl-phospholipid synthase-like protein [Dinothrombium tinctorium]|uniref:Cyclopropane-fatty-acyl-phospholipid synthase-like protein n=1 Tax=Dinothrombium tinctorium TaxID=1965070 RepID=A0A443RQ61_9ACAR|nr:cyclopropane-fatty-acyl-phospholipid synthase-like protein [Dinothrombium tinctorium]
MQLISHLLNRFLYYTLLVIIKIEKIFIDRIPGFTKKAVKKILEKHDIRIGNDRPMDIKINDERVYDAVVYHRVLGLGESYMKGWWDCDQLDEFSYRMCLRRGRVFQNALWRFIIKLNIKLYNYLVFDFDLLNLQSKSKSFEVGEKHYDRGNELFSAFLDPTLNYSCGYWRNASNLNQAQIDKMELISRKLKLKPGMKVLDIGCGWGGLCKYMAENYKVSVVGCTVSLEQATYAKKLCSDFDIDIRLVDYRDINEKFDRIVSVGMFEHVGEKNYRVFFEVVNRCLVDDGIFLLHTIGINDPRVPLTDAFAHKYIFPNGILPYYRHITKYTEGLFVIEDWQNFGDDYSKTLMAWHSNFEKAWPSLKSKYGEEFYRMWRFYLLTASGAFRARRLHLWQVVFSKNGLLGGYRSER